MRTPGEKFISFLHCVAKKEKSKRVPDLGGRELTDLSPDVLTAYTMAGPLSTKEQLVSLYLLVFGSNGRGEFEGI